MIIKKFKNGIIPSSDTIIADLNLDEEIVFAKVLNLLPKNSLPIQVNRHIELKQTGLSNSVNILVWEPFILLSFQENKGFIYTNTKDMLVNHQFDAINQLVSYISSQSLIVKGSLINQKNLENSIKNIEEVLDFIGFYGFISYETNQILETLDQDNGSIIPKIVFNFPRKYLISRDDELLYIELNEFEPIKIEKFLGFSDKGEYISKSKDLIGSLSYAQYQSKLRNILEHIKLGDIYQANFTQEFSLTLNEDMNTRRTYQDLTSEHIVPYHAYLEYPRFQIISLSPELFLQVNNGKVITRPIKGTLPRGKTEKEDKKLITALRSSEKDQAELAMIVDLLRNDLGRTSNPGSVQVDYHANVESYSNVHHLVSQICAEINPNDIKKSLQLLFRSFPGGSITGCPKISAMNIINKYETVPRGIYSGSIGFITVNGNLEFSIAIRTILVRHNLITFNTGGGIVFDSKPFNEYIESLHKVKHIAAYFGKSFVGQIYWYNGKFYTKGHDPMVNVSDHLASPPEGSFETIKISKGKPIRLEMHLRRIHKALSFFKFNEILPSTKEILQFIQFNIPDDARLNITITRYNEKEHCFMTIRPYTDLIDSIKLVIYPNTFTPQPYLKYGFKPLEYGKYRDATRYANSNNFWDAILVSDDGYLLETGKASLFVKFDEDWVTPSDNVVQGTIRQHLIKNDLVKPAKIRYEELQKAIAIMVGNALIGLKKVDCITKNKNIIWSNQGSSSILKLPIM